MKPSPLDRGETLEALSTNRLIRFERHFQKKFAILFWSPDFNGHAGPLTCNCLPITTSTTRQTDGMANNGKPIGNYRQNIFLCWRSNAAVHSMSFYLWRTFLWLPCKERNKWHGPTTKTRNTTSNYAYYMGIYCIPYIFLQFLLYFFCSVGRNEAFSFHFCDPVNCTTAQMMTPLLRTFFWQALRL